MSWVARCILVTYYEEDGITVTIISDEELNGLKIEKFIFHVIHHGDETPILLDEVPVEGHEEFFLERIKDTLKGNPFVFLDNSPVEQQLRTILNDESSFVEVSKELAVQFHQHEDKKIKPGVFMLILLSSGAGRFFSIIKYDHEQVLHYTLENDNKAVIKEITNGFTRSKDALHKAAFVNLEYCPGQLVIIDKTVKSEITNFFKNFLFVKKMHDEQEMTKKIQNLAIKTAQAHKGDLPDEFLTTVRSKAYDAISDMDMFEQNDYYDRVFGGVSNDSVRETFSNMLRADDLEGEQFVVNRHTLKKGQFKLKTREGVKIYYSDSNEHTVQIDRMGGRVRIIIETDDVTEQF